MSKCNTVRAPLLLDQIERILEHTKEDTAGEIYVAAMLAAYTGLRPGEIATLRWRDVNFDNNSLRFVDSKDHRMRIIHMQAIVAEFLRKLNLEREESDGIFNHPLPWLVCRLNRALRKACQKLGLPRINTHGLRRSFICNLAGLKQ